MGFTFSFGRFLLVLQKFSWRMLPSTNGRKIAAPRRPPRAFPGSSAARDSLPLSLT
jgi:hypothetical protein